MANKPEKKPVWQYAKEARERKAAAGAACAPPVASPKKGIVSAKKPTLDEEKVIVEVSNPDVDFNAPVIPLKLLKRAGVATYAAELKERALDVDEAPEGAYFLLPLKLPKKVYKKLVAAAIQMSDVSPEWTERDMIEAIIIFSNAEALTKVKSKA